MVTLKQASAFKRNKRPSRVKSASVKLLKPWRQATAAKRTWWAKFFGLGSPSTLGNYKSRLRFYQQLLLLLLFTVLLPLALLSIWLYDINDSALRKQITEFVQRNQTLLFKDLDIVASHQVQHMAIEARLFEQTFTAKSSTLPSKESLAQWLDTLPNKPYAAVICNAFTRQPLQWASTKPAQLSVSSLCQPNHQLYLPKQLPQFPDTEMALLKLAFEWHPPSTKASTLASTGGGSHWLVVLMPLPQWQPLWQAHEQALSQTIQLVPLYQSQAQKGSRGSLSQQANQWLNQALKQLNLQEGLLIDVPEGYQSVFNTPRLMAHRMSDLPMAIVASTDAVFRQGPVQQARWRTFLLIGISLGISLFVGLFYIIAIIRSFRQLIKGIKAMAKGNYNRKIRLITNWATPFELIYLTGEFNRMARKLGEQWRTIQQANVQLAQLDEAKSNLIDTVSHELRTPLMSIQGFANQLIRHGDTLTTTQRLDRLKTIRLQSKRLERLVDDLLVIPELDKAMLRIHPEPIVLLTLLQPIIHPFINDPRQQAPLCLEGFDGLESVCIEADAVRLEQIIVNLLENAYKYNHPQEAPITLRLRLTTWQQQPAITVGVCNASLPIAPEELAQLFDKFKRLDEGLTRTTRGSGLGLYIAKALSEAMQGQLVLHYEEGRFEAQVIFKTL
jgi:signal transduction histidine kinase